MAMDQELLLQRLQKQYLTRREVLYRLPLNISVNTFWSELTDRRKKNSTVLPLHRGDGRPLWYVLTDQMIAASEKLCMLALENDQMFDPYRAGITSAMMEEVFFTSFVEGAQIDLREAMDFLGRGTEPENVQEQMILNNHSAWTDMTKLLYYPPDERFVRTLAYRLTAGMDNQATDYRQKDEHIIAAMAGQTYELPTAAAIPALMREYYGFLADTEVHPLIQAAVGQAYPLIIRPFPEGNERLARMISYAVLLRSGYDFFRDIPISGMIARESFRYYKSMQDIIRGENGGDLTYFMEYYLDLLARAVDVHMEMRERKLREAAERETAEQPLINAREPLLPHRPEEEESSPIRKEPAERPDGKDTAKRETENLREAAAGAAGDDETAEGPTECAEQMTARQAIEEMLRSAGERERRTAEGLLEMLDNGYSEFAPAEWRERHPASSKDAVNQMLHMALNRGLLEYSHGKYRFRQRIRRGPQCDHMSDRQRELLLQLMRAFLHEKFSMQDAVETTGNSYSTISYYLESFVQRGILNTEHVQRNKTLYSFAEAIRGALEKKEKEEVEEKEEAG